VINDEMRGNWGCDVGRDDLLSCDNWLCSALSALKTLAYRLTEIWMLTTQNYSVALGIVSLLSTITLAYDNLGKLDRYITE